MLGPDQPPAVRAARFEAVATCSSEEECGQASVGLNYCLASIVCKEKAAIFKSMAGRSADEAGEAYDDMLECLRQTRKQGTA